MPRENKCWSCCPQQHSGLSLCGTQLNMAHCPRREEKVGKDRPGTGHSKSITQHCKANKERGQTPPRPAWSTTWRVQTAVQKAMVFKKRRGRGAEDNIYTCMSEQAENSGDHFEMYKNTEAVHCAPGTALQVKYTSKTNSHKHRSDLWVPGAIRRGNWRKVVKGTNFQLKVSAVDVMYTMTNVINTPYFIYES